MQTLGQTRRANTRTQPFYKLFLVILAVFLILPVRQVFAQEATPYELIDLTNGLRTSYGNSPLELSSALMASAQTTAEIMAATRACGHLGDASGRAAAAGFGGGGTVFATENIACGNNMSAADIITLYWSDALHLLPATMTAYTHVGAGVAHDADGFSYYVLHAAYSANNPGTKPGGVSVPGATVPALSAQQPVLPLIQPVQKAEPESDGSIVHVVGYGQTLSGISSAYEVPLERLVELNPIIGPNMVIYEKQKLLIQLPQPATATPEVTATPEPTATVTPTPLPSATPTPIVPTATLLPAGTIYPTATSPSVSGLSLGGSAKTVGIIVLAVSAVGLGMMLYSGFNSRRKK